MNVGLVIAGCCVWCSRRSTRSSSRVLDRLPRNLDPHGSATARSRAGPVVFTW